MASIDSPNAAPRGLPRPWAIVVLESSDGRISGLHHFLYPELFADFGLPTHLDG